MKRIILPLLLALLPLYSHANNNVAIQASNEHIKKEVKTKQESPMHGAQKTTIDQSDNEHHKKNHNHTVLATLMSLVGLLAISIIAMGTILLRRKK